MAMCGIHVNPLAIVFFLSIVQCAACMYAIVIYDIRMEEIAPISYQYIYNSMWFYIVIGLFCIIHLVANSNDQSPTVATTQKTKCNMIVYMSATISMITLSLNTIMFYNDLIIEPINDAGVSANEAVIAIITSCMFMCFISWIHKAN